jgi:diguanylate cyclase (GGDEF)-like protein
MLHLRSTHVHAPEVQERWEWLAMMLADRLALALANLQLRQRLRVQAVRDPLTSLFNRRYLDETLERELQRAERYNHSVGIIILDIDHFKAFNTIHGLRGGDATLRAVGAFLQRHTRSGDVACRFGGEEFTLVLPHASLDDTRRRAEELRESIKHLQVVYEDRTLQTITVSLGVSCFPLHGTTVESVIAAADYALGLAKASGRDRVVIAELPT